MKMRTLKNHTRLIAIKPTITVQLFQVYRKKDGKLVKIADSKLEAQALIRAAKAGKKAALYIGGSYRQKYAR